MHRVALDGARAAHADLRAREALSGEEHVGVHAHTSVLARTDVYDARVLQVEMRLPTLEEAAAFCVESGPTHPAPFATHKPWRHRSLHELAELAAACPELAPLAALTGVVLP